MDPRPYRDFAATQHQIDPIAEKPRAFHDPGAPIQSIGGVVRNRFGILGAKE
jgi:hypothetical protein